MTRFVFIVAFFILFSGFALAQPGIYTEADIEIQALFIDAQLEKQKGNPEKQIELLKEVIKRDRTADAAYFELARAYALIGNNELAEKNGRRAYTLDTYNVWYISLLIDIYEDSNKHSDAIQLCHVLIAMESNEDKHYQRLAFNQLRSGNADQAIATLEDLENKRGVQEDISKKIFEIYHNSGDIEKAASTLRKLSQEFPYNVRFLGNLAGYLYDNGLKDQAVREYERLLQLDPDNAEASLVLAKEKNNGQVTKLMAIEDLCENESIPLDNIIQELMPYMANMQRDGEDTNSLKRISQKLLERYPEDAKTHAVRADILFYAGDLAESEKRYEKAIELDDSKYTLWDQWLINLWELENYKKMRNKSLLAIDYYPNQVNPMIYYAIASYKLGDADEAEDFLMEAKFIAGNNAKYLNAINVVNTWLQKSELSNEEIKDELEAIDDMLIYNPLFFELKGDLYHKLLDSSRSKENWNRAVEMGADKDRIQKKLHSIN